MTTQAVDSFENIYRQNYRSVKSVVNSFRFSAETVDDLIQDIFLKAWNNLNTLDNPATFAGWIRVIARNRCIEELRRTKPTVALAEEVASEEDSVGHAAVLIADDISTSIHWEHSVQFVGKIIENHEGEPRATIARLFYLKELSVKEIAEQLNINQNTILSHLRRFRLMVSQSILDYVDATAPA